MTRDDYIRAVVASLILLGCIVYVARVLWLNHQAYRAEMRWHRAQVIQRIRERPADVPDTFPAEWCGVYDQMKDEAA